MKKVLITILSLIPCWVAAQDKFEISGKFLHAGSNKMVMLTYVNSEGKIAKDSAVLKNDTFRIAGTTAFGNKSYLALVPLKDSLTHQRQSDEQTFYLEKGKYRVTGTDSIATAKITGAQAQTDYLLFSSEIDTLIAQYKALTARYYKARAEKDTATLQQIAVEGKPLGIKINATIDSFIFHHPDSYVSLDLVVSEKASVIDQKNFDPFYNVLSKRVLASFSGQKLMAKYEKARQLFIGQPFDFTQEDAEGKLFKLSSLRGKYVLVDFWASWCAPCRAENPHLLKAYQALKNKNFEVVGVSLDEKKANWLKAIAMDGMPWVQVSDLKGWKSEIAIKYSITAIPQNVLIDPKGVIIAKNLRGEDLDSQLAKLIN
ncbi:Thiol-disulfide isomerase or thioredoxin [Chitinophaga costaii]|uniref:Thiol-disulfide isomerase or thioredoxin n=1 Tax=Chitinophaga costaii TaxID=1335309 RepID=A0A1C4CUW8_9BACT|nr:TlpA disulfide reductase family protein [Chitinophaga costaii]PUZ26932.1 AhpC/TSA family protein [Chitinophaga costaii]SCC22964.1 Thiol-disulfide isomerase or thioredoxin [Chitinophaga costaii]